MLAILKQRKYYYALSLTLVVLSFVFLAVWGLKPGIDFTGGSLLEVSFQGMNRPSVEEIQSTLNGLDYLSSGVTIQPTGDQAYSFRFKDITEEQHQEILNKLSEKFAASSISAPAAETKNGDVQVVTDGGLTLGGIQVQSTDKPIVKVQEERFDSIGPSIGQELKTKSLYAVILVIICIILYITWSFRKVGKLVPSWQYGVTAIVAVVHDVAITCGVFAVLGKFMGIEINTAFIVAVLTVLGYSVNDTIVVFDRIRENLHRYHASFEETVNISVNETMVRSINTSLTVLFTLLAIFFFGGESIKYFALALIIGVFFGTYSSIFVASSLLVTWQNWRNRKTAK